jgi:chromosomal replication initiation ATPase DnaA
MLDTTSRLHALHTAPMELPALSAAATVRVGWYIPPRFKQCVLALCPAPTPENRCACPGIRHYVAVTPSQRQAHAAASSWAEAAGRGDGITLALVGSVGTGKSHLLYAAIRRLNEREINAGAWGWYDLADHLRAAASERDPGLRKEAGDQRAKAHAVRALGLDELRPTSGTDYDGTALSNLMTRAYRECQDVFITSNFADRQLEEIIGLAAASRLSQLQITGPDYRKPGALAA